MLVLTPEASKAVNLIVSQRGEGGNRGVRISGSERDEDDDRASAEGLHLSVVAEPESDDAIAEEAPVYIEPETAEFLDDKVLDAEIAEEVGQVRFSFHEQAA